MQPKVIIDNQVYRKIMHWVNKSDHEVSGLGIVALEPDGIMRVTHAMLLPQVNTGTSTDIEPEDAAKMLYKCKDLPGDLRFWWHSHVNMEVFWSGTDMDTIKKIGAGGWFLSTVFNKKREMRTAFYSVNGTVTPFGTFPLFQDLLDTKVEPFLEPSAERWDAEYAENVKARVYQSHFQRHPWSGDRTTSGGVSGNDGRVHGVLNPLVDRRPYGVPKKEWKRMRRQAREISAHAIETVRKITYQPPALLPQDVTDVYGFTQDDRTILAEEGWTDADIDLLFNADVTPQEMLELASNDRTAEEVIELISLHWSPQDIIQFDEKFDDDEGPNDDTPVMDRANGGKYDA